jgi:Glycosyl hydrolase family 99/Glycosyltransferase WbsX
MEQSTEINLLLAWFLGLSCSLTQPDDPPKHRPLILVHVMPWFESKPISGTWGWHWTMGHFDPERSDAKGKREIASHDYPLIGPYDSADPDVLEYHALLMKIAGINGVVADWYGNEDFNDYASIHRRTMALFDSLKRRRLKFAVCYEDRVLKAMSERNKWTPAQALEHGKTHLRFCEENWFKEPSYVTLEGRPLLMVFGPDFLSPAQWEAILAGMKLAPAFLTLHERKAPAVGSFAWPPMWASKDGKLDATELDAYLDRFTKQRGLTVACAFPGFHDIYKEAGVQPSHGFLDPRDGETFRHTLDRAVASGSPIVQIATWNDFGEGTSIEPTREFGYRYLEAIQEARRRFPDGPFPYQAADLRLPLRVYQLRKKLASSSPQWKALDEAVDLLHAGEVAEAQQRLDALEKTVPQSPK